MKNLIAFLICLLLPAFIFAEAIRAGSKITVSLPVVKNAAPGEEWIPLFVQGQLSSDIQNYSPFTVIDRTAAEQLLGEQKLKEANSYLSATEDSSIQYASLVDSDYLITVNLIKKSASWALDCKVMDVKSSGTVGKSYSNANVMNSALEDGSIIHNAAYEILAGLGIDSAELKALLSQTQTQIEQATAQASVAKGIVAEQGGSNIEALTYYIRAKKSDKNLSEATSRMANMTNVVTGGNFGANAKNLIKMRNDWDKLLREAAELIAANPPEFTLYYYSDLKADEMTEEDYERGTMTIEAGLPFLISKGGSENSKITDELRDCRDKIPESKNWGNKINNFPWAYAEDIPGDNWLKRMSRGESEQFVFSMQLLDAKKKIIGQTDITFTVKYYADYHTKIDIRWPYLNKFYTTYNRSSKSPAPKRFSFDQVKIDDADTDSLYLTVKQKSGRDVSILPFSELEKEQKQAEQRKAEQKKKDDEQRKRLNNVLDQIFSQKKVKDIKLEGFYPPESLLTIFRAVREYSKGKINLDLSGVTGMKRIYEKAFYDCKTLQSITLPDSLVTIEKSAFHGCDKLKTVYWMGTADSWSKLKWNSRNTTLDIGNQDPFYVSDNEPLIKAKKVFNKK